MHCCTSPRSTHHSPPARPARPVRPTDIAASFVEEAASWSVSGFINSVLDPPKHEQAQAVHTMGKSLMQKARASEERTACLQNSESKVCKSTRASNQKAREEAKAERAEYKTLQATKRAAKRAATTKEKESEEDVVYMGCKAEKRKEIEKNKCERDPKGPNVDHLESSMAVQMVTLSAVTYLSGPLRFENPKPYSNVYGWKLEHKMRLPSKFLGMVVGNDYMFLYSKNNTCAVAFSGSNDIGDFITDAKSDGREWCGRKEMHRGFAGEIDRFLNAKEWERDVLPILRSKDKCGNGVVLTGHSLGGAMASMVAWCTNWQGKKHAGDDRDDPVSKGTGWDVKVDGYGHGGRLWTTKQLLSGFKVVGLYTIGAPAVMRSSNVKGEKYYRRQLYNDEAEDGCFPGLRMFNHGKAGSDPIAWLGSAVLNDVVYRHPKMRALGLGDAGESATEYACGEEISSTKPDPPRGTLHSKIKALGQFMLHKATSYIRRAMDQLCLQGNDNRLIAHRIKKNKAAHWIKKKVEMAHSLVRRGDDEEGRWAAGQ